MLSARPARVRVCAVGPRGVPAACSPVRAPPPPPRSGLASGPLQPRAKWPPISHHHASLARMWTSYPPPSQAEVREPAARQSQGRPPLWAEGPPTCVPFGLGLQSPVCREPARRVDSRQPGMHTAGRPPAAMPSPGSALGGGPGSLGPLGALRCSGGGLSAPHGV